jgi:hypothetical protein
MLRYPLVLMDGEHSARPQRCQALNITRTRSKPLQQCPQSRSSAGIRVSFGVPSDQVVGVVIKECPND